MKKEVNADTRSSVTVFVFIIAYVALIGYIMRDYFMDDAYIGFRYLDNYLSGHGFVFNPGEHVEGVTNIGWLLFLIPFTIFGTPPVIAKFLGGILIVVTAFFSCLIFQRSLGKNSSKIVKYILPILIVTQFDYIFFSLSGMETALQSLLLCLIVYLGSFERLRIFNAILCSFAFLIHPESILIYPIAFVIDVVSEKDAWRKHIAPLIVFISGLAIITSIRYIYYTDILPNTFHAKSLGFQGLIYSFYRFLDSANINIPAPFTGIFVLIFMAYGLIKFWRYDRRMSIYMIAIIFVGFAFCIYAPEDWTGLGRYFVPYVPICFIVLWRGIIDVSNKLFHGMVSNKYINMIIIMSFITLLAGNVMETGFWLRPKMANEYPGFVLTSKNLVEPSLWIKNNLPDNSTIACFRIGALSYYSKKNVFDYKFGLTDKDVARLTGKNVNLQNPLNPKLETIWRKKSPDYWLTDLDKVETVVRESGGSINNFQIHGIRYRLIKKFPIGENPLVYWALCEKIYNQD